MSRCRFIPPANPSPRAVENPSATIPRRHMRNSRRRRDIGQRLVSGRSSPAWRALPREHPEASFSMASRGEAEQMHVAPYGPSLAVLWPSHSGAREALSPFIAMYALDGPPRFTHIWPFVSLD